LLSFWLLLSPLATVRLRLRFAAEVVLAGVVAAWALVREVTSKRLV
jgi:hypothetical protein